jgi:drug/metabolite transporter (DMT)-like permease
VLALAAVSLTPIFLRVSELEPTATSFYRPFLSIPVFALWVGAMRRRGVAAMASSAPRWGRDGWAILGGGLFFAVNIASYAWSVRLTSVANASLIANLTPIFVTLGGFALFGERVSRAFLAALATAIAGAAILGGDKLSFGAGGIVGDGLALLSAISFAAYLMTIARLRLRLPSSTVMLWMSVVTSLGLLAGALVAGESLAPPTLAGWWALIGLSLVSYALGQGLFTASLARLGASFSAVAMLSLPVLSSVLAWGLLGERPTLRQAVGGAIILAGVFVARRAAG